MSQSNSAPAMLITGQVMHQRLRPVMHRFVYRVFYLRINLARINELNSFLFGINRWRIVSLFTRDYGSRDGSDLLSWMRNLLKESGIDAQGEIWLQTFPRLFGFVFNPVSFWYCYDTEGKLRAVLAEVNNTFGETHRYLLCAQNQQVITNQTQLYCLKEFHVSPFCQVQGQYRFNFHERVNGTSVKLDYFDEFGLLIKTAVGGRSELLTRKNLSYAVLLQPWMTLNIVWKIHWQALKLWLKHVPWFSKPTPPDDQLTRSIPSQLTPLISTEESSL